MIGRTMLSVFHCRMRSTNLLGFWAPVVAEAIAAKACATPEGKVAQRLERKEAARRHAEARQRRLKEAMFRRAIEKRSGDDDPDQFSA